MARGAEGERKANIRRLIPTNLSDVRAVMPPPSGFDPLRASKAQLLAYGYPFCPDPKKWPAAALYWRRMLSRPLRHVNPELRPRPESKRSLQGRSGPGVAEEGGPWCGAVIGADALGGDACQQITGCWTVPSVVQTSTPTQGDWWSVAWVGMDGALAASPAGQNDVLQAGTAQHVNVDGNGNVTTEYFGWYEWEPTTWIEIPNSPGTWEIQPGDWVSVTVQYLGSVLGVQQGTATHTNLTRGLTTSHSFSAPAGTVFVGSSAEWILEAPTINGAQANLPNFGNIIFTGCYACAGDDLFDCSMAQPNDISNAAGQIITKNGLVSSQNVAAGWDCQFTG